MPLAAPAALLAVALAAVVLGWLLRDLRVRRARPAAFGVVIGAYGLAAAGWLAALVADLPVWAAWLGSLPAIGLTFAPARVVRWTGGPSRQAGLREAVLLLRDAVALPWLGPADRDRLRARVRRLDRFRTPETAELLDLVAEAAYDRLDELPLDAATDATRTARIDALLDVLDPRAA